MSRCSATTIWKTMNITQRVLMLGLLVLCMPMSLMGQSGDITAVRIEYVPDVSLNQEVSLSVDLEQVAAGTVMSGFDLLMAFDRSGLHLQDVQQGQLLTDCEWEYFTYRVGDAADCGGEPCTEGVVRIVAIAETLNGEIHPSCFADTAGQLAQLTFLTTSDPNALSHLFPVRFYWMDCGDNSFADLLGDTLYISDQVFEFNGQEYTDPDFGFPSYFGAQAECDDTLDPIATRRAIDFHHGGVMMSSTPGPSDADAVITIDKLYNVWSGHLNPYDGADFNVGINLQYVEPTRDYDGFDFLIRFDHLAMSVTGVQPGELLDSCGWEYFTYRVGSVGNCGGLPCPDNIVRIVSVADINDGANHPSCLTPNPGQLARISFHFPYDTGLMNQTYLLEWLWYDCGDNVMSNPVGDTIFFSREVYDVNGFAITADSAFPTQYGVPASCIPGGLDSVYRKIDFFTGSVRVPPAELDIRGDVNLNGIAYEIADWVLFSNYFFFGLSAFTVNQEAQTAATDANANGLTLELSDLMYIYRVVIGDAYPYPMPPLAPFGDTVALIQDTLANTISVDYDDSLSALYLVIEGNIEPVDALPDHDLSWYFDTTYTRILVFPGVNLQPDEALLDSGLVFTYTGDGQLGLATATYDGLYDLLTKTLGSAPTSCCENRGNVDGVVGVGGPIDVGDLSALVDYLFEGGSLSDCPEEANVDGIAGVAGPIDVGDLTCLVDYLFKAGPPPPPCLYPSIGSSSE